MNVDWDKDARVAHLKGTVDSARERERAAQVAETAVGTSGKVLNEVTVENVNEKTADDMDGRIRSELKDMIGRDQVLRDRDIDFDVNNGVVTVKGEVRTTAEKTKVSDMVKNGAWREGLRQRARDQAEAVDAPAGYLAPAWRPAAEGADAAGAHAARPSPRARRVEWRARSVDPLESAKLAGLRYVNDRSDAGHPPHRPEKPGSATCCRTARAWRSQRNCSASAAWAFRRHGPTSGSVRCRKRASPGDGA